MNRVDASLLRPSTNIPALRNPGYENCLAAKAKKTLFTTVSTPADANNIRAVRFLMQSWY